MSARLNPRSLACLPKPPDLAFTCLSVVSSLPAPSSSLLQPYPRLCNFCIPTAGMSSAVHLSPSLPPSTPSIISASFPSCLPHLLPEPCDQCHPLKHIQSCTAITCLQPEFYWTMMSCGMRLRLIHHCSLWAWHNI